jgi:hypothetical protein
MRALLYFVEAIGKWNGMNAADAVHPRSDRHR